MARRHEWVRSEDGTGTLWRCKRCPVWREFARDDDGVMHEFFHTSTVTRKIPSHDEQRDGCEYVPPLACGVW